MLLAHAIALACNNAYCIRKTQIGFARLRGYQQPIAGRSSPAAQSRR
jgi:hypothetical protein